MLSHPNLDRIDSPDGAVAAATQLRGNAQIAYPRGFSTRLNVPGLPRTMPAPGHDSAMWFKELFRGYLSAHDVHFLSGQSDVRTLLTADSIELLAHLANNTASAGPDDSLKPRGIAVWVHVHAGIAESAVGERFLDALAEWTDATSSDMRTSIVTTSESAEMLQITRAESTQFRELCPSWSFRVSVRWACPMAKMTRTETAHFNHTPASSDAVLADVQQAVVRLVGTHSVNFPTVLMKAPTKTVPRHAFPYKQRRLGEEFIALCTGKPSVTLDAAATMATCGPLENTGIVMRMCNKSMGAAGLVHASAFHGVLLSFGARRDDAIAFVAEAVSSESNCMRMPIGMQEETMGMHICAVQAERRSLGQRISLYSATGVPGKPIHRPHSWVWIESAAIRPIDDHLLGAFDARPCSKSSILPRNPALEVPYKAHFKMASQLYLSLGDNPTKSLPRSATFSSTSSDEFATADPGTLLPTETDDEAIADERFLLAAMRVDLQSRRTTIGEAYAYLSDIGPPSSVTKMMLHAAGRLGINSSLDSMLDLCVDAVRVHNIPARVVDENDRLKRLADVALGALVDEPPAKRGPLVAVATPDRVRRLLAAAGVKRGSSVIANVRDVPKASEVSKVAELVVEALRTDSRVEYSSAALSVLHDGLRPSCDFEHAIARSVRVALIASGLTVAPPIFMITSASDRNEVRVEQLAMGCSTTSASLDDMCAEATPSVLIVQKTDNLKYRVTSTVSIEKR